MIECPISPSNIYKDETCKSHVSISSEHCRRSAATIRVNETPTLEAGDTLEFSDLRCVLYMCGIVPTSFTVSSVNGSEIAVNEAVETGSSGTTAHCAITHVPLTGCSNRVLDSASSGGTAGDIVVINN